MPFPGVTVTLLSASVTGTDDRGNDVCTWTSVDIGGCAWVPGATSETVQATDQVVANAQCYFPAGTVITPQDRVIYLGQTYEVTGVPDAWTSPFTSMASPVLVRLRKVTGASARQAGSGVSSA